MHGVSVGHVRDICVLRFYADDVVMVETAVDVMNRRLTKFAYAALAHANIKTKMSKTNSQLLCKRQKPAPGTEQAIEDKKSPIHTCQRRM